MQITINNLTKKFDSTVAVNNLSFNISSGNLVALLGPSGCGKTTLLNIISGIIPATSGEILFNQKNITKAPAHKRGIGMVFQNYALYPHMTVMENICFPLEIKRMDKKERKIRANELAELVRIEELLQRKPKELSGGQQQRVAIARALAKNPDVLLLDEPLSNLDAKLRVEMREEIRRIQQETKVTTLFVTHDQEEASTIADKIILFNKGTVQQDGSVRDLYHNPINSFVADFFGVPSINKLYGKLHNKLFILTGELTSLPLDINLSDTIPDDKSLMLTFRPESIYIDEKNPLFHVKIKEVYMQGRENLVLLELGESTVRSFFDESLQLKKGDVLPIRFRNKGVFLFDVETGVRYC